MSSLCKPPAPQSAAGESSAAQCGHAVKNPHYLVLATHGTVPIAAALPPSPTVILSLLAFSRALESLETCHVPHCFPAGPGGLGQAGGAPGMQQSLEHHPLPTRIGGFVLFLARAQLSSIATRDCGGTCCSTD